MYRYELLKDLNCEFHCFDSQQDQIEEVLKNISKHRGNRAAWNSWEPSDVLGDRSFLGRSFSNWQDVRRALEAKWDEGMKIYDRMMKDLGDTRPPQPKSIRRQRRWSEDEGDEISIDRLMRGQAYWDQTYRDHRPGPVGCTIVANMSTLGHVDHSNVLWRGAASVLLTEILEKAGYRVELWAVAYVTNPYVGSSRSHMTAVNYKRGSDPLDVSTLISGVSAWCYRSLFFATRNSSEFAPRHGLGQSRNDLDKTELQHITPDEQAMVCQNIWSQHAAIGWVREQLARMFQTP